MEKSQSYAYWLWVLLAIFVCRVIAQLSQAFFDFPFLPPFDAWYSGALPYPWLLASQIILIVVMVMVARRFSRGTVKARKGWGQMLLGLGLVYFTVMLIRLMVGLTGVSDMLWFNRPIPSFFHLVLASFVILVGHFHFMRDRRPHGAL